MLGICWRGLAVDIIRRLWDHGLFQDNEKLQLIHDQWLHFWVDYRTEDTMRSVDSQTKRLNSTPVTIAEPVKWEEGDTIGFTYEFPDDDS